MAIYHLSMKIIGGGSGRTAIGASLYRRGEKLHNEHDNRRNAIGAAAYHRGDESHDGNTLLDYTKKRGVVYSEIMLPEHASLEYMDSQTLWNAAQNAEKQHNARTAREIVIALPNELTPEQKIKVTRDYVQRNFVDEGMCADFSIHAGHIHTRKGEIYPFEDLAIQKENPHVHIQLTVRPLNEDGTFCKTKTRKEYILDKNGERVRTKSGKGWVSRNVGLTDWDKTETLIKWRKDWAVTVNKELERLEIDERISHLSLKEQGINREPTKHMGHEAWNLEKKGVNTEIGNENRAIMAQNKALEQLEKEAREHEPSIREKLASILNEQGINHELDAPITPQATAEYIHELKQGYVIVDREVTILNNETSAIEREINSMSVKSEEVEERAEGIRILRERIDVLKMQRQGMGIFRSKKAINEQIQSLERSQEQAENYFKRTYNINPEEAGTEVKRLQHEIESKKHLQERLQDKMTTLVEKKEVFKLEYHRQKLRAEISLNGQQVQDRLKQLHRESLSNVKSPKDDIARAKSEHTLVILTEQDYQKILNELQPEQAKALTKHREMEKARSKDYGR